MLPDLSDICFLIPAGRHLKVGGWAHCWRHEERSGEGQRHCEQEARRERSQQGYPSDPGDDD